MAAKGKTYDTHAIGRRKTAVARIYMSNGSGKITVNKRDVKNFFKQETNLYVVNQPLNLTKLTEKFDFVINVNGGGISGQAGAIRLGIARALLKIQPKLKGVQFFQFHNGKKHLPHRQKSPPLPAVPMPIFSAL